MVNTQLLTAALRLINSNNAVPFTAYSSPPTVTLPRLKGITTGSTPNFLDAILNIAESDTSSTLANQDSWLSQLKQQGKRIRMFGDDTWIKLFPGMFEQTDGTASFFVSDFTEVDNNVTRHLDSQISARNDWDVMILHYLGLDHIGHKGGPQSVFMPAKQQEMDDIIKKLYQELVQQDDDTLMVVLGDHGMNEAGNHGGSSAGETSAATLLVSPKFQQLKLNHHAPLPEREDFKFYNKISQGDLVPTLAALFDFPVPLNSLGVFLRDLLPLWRTENRKEVLLQNMHQLANIISTSYPEFNKLDAGATMFCESLIDIKSASEVDELKCLWWLVQNTFDEQEAYEFIEKAQEIMSQASSNYKDKEMLIGLGLATASTLVSGFATWSLLQSVKTIRFLVILMTSLYAVTMFGSSLVEEEHHFWYWGATGWIAWLYILSARRKFKDGFDWVFVMIIIRVIRSWNQTGQKYAGGPDIASYLSTADNAPYLWFLIIAYYGSLFERLWKGSYQQLNTILGFVISFMTVAASIAFKAHMAFEAGENVPVLIQKLTGLEGVSSDLTRLIGLARLSFLTIGAGALYEFSNIILGDDDPKAREKKKPFTNMIAFLEAFFVMQTRTTNIPLFIFFNLLRIYLTKAINRSFVYRSTKDLDDDKQEKFNVRVISITTVSILIFQHMSFFAMGNSNSMASIDLSNAYNGISSYNVSLVGVLTFIGNWAGPLFWSCIGLSILLEDDFRVHFIKLHSALKTINKTTETQKPSSAKSTNTTTPEITPQLFVQALANADVSQVGQNVLSLKILITQFFFSGALVGIMGACIMLKDHLFIWTVFSPKLLYGGAWVAGMHCLVDVFATVIISLLFR